MRPHPLLLGGLALVTAVAVLTASPGSPQPLPEATTDASARVQQDVVPVVLTPGDPSEQRFVYTHADPVPARVGLLLDGTAPDGLPADSVQVSVTGGELSLRASLDDLLDRTDPLWLTTDLGPGESLPLTIETTPGVDAGAGERGPTTYELSIVSEDRRTEPGP